MPDVWLRWCPQPPPRPSPGEGALFAATEPWGNGAAWGPERGPRTRRPCGPPARNGGWWFYLLFLVTPDEPHSFRHPGHAPAGRAIREPALNSIQGLAGAFDYMSHACRGSGSRELAVPSSGTTDIFYRSFSSPPTSPTLFSSSRTSAARSGASRASPVVGHCRVGAQRAAPLHLATPFRLPATGAGGRGDQESRKPRGSLVRNDGFFSGAPAPDSSPRTSARRARDPGPRRNGTPECPPPSVAGKGLKPSATVGEGFARGRRALVIASHPGITGGHAGPPL